MRNKFIRYIKGYVKVRLETSMPERFISLCAKNQIDIWNLTNENMYYVFEISAKDFFRLVPFRRKTSAHLVILEKHGLPFFFQFVQKRKAFFLGIFCFMFILYFNSTILWDIRVNGNSFYSDETILEELQSFEVNSGMFKSKLNCKEIAAQIRNSFPNVVWVSAKLEGCCLILDIKENENPNVDEIVSSDSWDLVATKDGEIVKIVTRKGVPIVAQGDTCKAGDILVQGTVEILSQDLLVQRLEYVGADADIQIKTQYAYYDEFSLVNQKKIYDEREIKLPLIRLGNNEFSYIPHLKENQELYFDEKPLFLTNSLPLPLSFGWINLRSYEIEQQLYTEDEAKEIALLHLQNYLEDMVAKGMTILEKELEFSIRQNKVYYSGYIWVLESPVTKQAIQTQPPENAISEEHTPQ